MGQIGDSVRERERENPTQHVPRRELDSQQEGL